MHLGHSVAAAMWAMTALSLGFVALRLYTRIHIVHFFGAEDYLYLCTGVMLVAFTASIQVAVHYGLGTSFWTLSLDETSNAILWTYIANTFAVTGNAMAKLSLGVFLLRVVQMKAQKAALWLLNIVTAATSTALVIMVWNQTTPVKTSWDPLRTPGTWNIEIKPMGVGLGAWSSVCDFVFAIFPWLFIWSLHMPRREKIFLAGGMSLGVLAGACGIVRTIVLAEVSVNDYTLNFAKYFAWAGAEIAVSMICLGLPTLRPLYVKSTGTTLYERGHTGQQGDPELAQFASKPASPTPPLPPPDQKERPRTPNFFRNSGATDVMLEMETATDTPQTRLSKAAAARVRGQSADSSDPIFGPSVEQRSRGWPREGLAGGRNSGAAWKNRTSDSERRLSNWPLRS